MSVSTKVVLVDKDNNELGIMEKSKVHTDNTPLHRGLSVFLLNSEGELLLQKRAKSKLTFPGVWSNSCCGHPQPGEEGIDAAKRHLRCELGIVDSKIFLVLPDYSYTAKMNGVKENELCPVFVGFSDEQIEFNPEEVETVVWIMWKDFLREVTEKPGTYSSWSEEEALLLDSSKKFNELMTKHTGKKS